MDQPAREMEPDHPPRAFGDGDEIEGIRGARSCRARCDARRRPPRVRRDRPAIARPHHDRRDQIARTGRIVVEQAQHRIAAIARARAPRAARASAASTCVSPASQRPPGSAHCAAMGAQARGAPCQQQRRSRRRVGLGQRDGDRGALQRRRRLAAGRRANAAQRAAIFRLVASSKGRSCRLTTPRRRLMK